MKILFIAQHYLDNNANANCLKNLLDEFEDTDTVDVAVIDKNDLHYKNNKINIHIIQDRIFFTTKQNISYLKKNFFSMFGYIVKKFFLKIFKSRVYNATCNLTIRKLNRLVGEERYDSIISVSNPFYCHYLAYKIKQKNKAIKWQAYYLDPYSFNDNNKLSFKKCYDLECKLLKYADSIVITDKMHEEFSSCGFKDFLPKTIICDFPNVKNRTLSKNSSIIFDANSINCVFVGYLYPDIRNPEFFLKLLSKSDEKIKFYIVGGIYGDLKNLDLELYKNKLGDRLKIIDVVPIDEAFRIMNDSDVLLNIGNSIQNQLPSKIFDYISTGKPIVNVCKLDECLSLKYTQKYPMCLNIFETNGINNDIIKQFEDFCKNSKGQRVSYDYIEKKYETSTPKFVSRQIKKALGD